MKPNRFTRPLMSAAVAAALLAPLAASAIDRTSTTAGTPAVSGGVSVQELQTLRREMKSNDYNLWLVTAAKSGAHLSDAKVTVMARDGGEVVATTMAGPWLLADLPNGTYRVVAEFEGQTQERQITVTENGLRQLVLYFESDAVISPDLLRERGQFAQAAAQERVMDSGVPQSAAAPSADGVRPLSANGTRGSAERDLTLAQRR